MAFSDVYELKEEVGQTATSVSRRCLHRVTAVEYSVKVVDVKPLLEYLDMQQSSCINVKIYTKYFWTCIEKNLLLLSQHFIALTV